jgi:hypothetical protein
MHMWCPSVRALGSASLLLSVSGAEGRAFALLTPWWQEGYSFRVIAENGFLTVMWSLAPPTPFSSNLCFSCALWDWSPWHHLGIPPPSGPWVWPVDLSNDTGPVKEQRMGERMTVTPKLPPCPVCASGAAVSPSHLQHLLSSPSPWLSFRWPHFLLFRVSFPCRQQFPALCAPGCLRTLSLRLCK